MDEEEEYDGYTFWGVFVFIVLCGVLAWMDSDMPLWSAFLWWMGITAVGWLIGFIFSKIIDQARKSSDDVIKKNRRDY